MRKKKVEVGNCQALKLVLKTREECECVLPSRSTMFSVGWLHRSVCECVSVSVSCSFPAWMCFWSPGGQAAQEHMANHCSASGSAFHKYTRTHTRWPFLKPPTPRQSNSVTYIQPPPHTPTGDWPTLKCKHTESIAAAPGLLIIGS